MVDNENHYALKTGGKRALMHAVLSLTNRKRKVGVWKTQWIGRLMNGWVNLLSARRGDDEDAMTALKVIQSIPLI